MRLRCAFVAQVVHRAPVPHRQRVGAFPFRDAPRLARLHVEEPHIGRHAAAIALPGAVVGRVRGVGEPLARLVERAVRAVGNRQHRGQPARCGDGVELRGAREAVDSARHEDETRAIGRPVTEAFDRGVMRHALRDAALRRDRVEVETLVVVAAEGDRSSIGREAGRALEAARARERARGAALLRRNPKIVRVDEDDLRLRDIRVAAEPLRGRGVVGGPCSGREAESEGRCCEGERADRGGGWHVGLEVQVRGGIVRGLEDGIPSSTSVVCETVKKTTAARPA